MTMHRFQAGNEDEFQDHQDRAFSEECGECGFPVKSAGHYQMCKKPKSVLARIIEGEDRVVCVTPEAARRVVEAADNPDAFEVRGRTVVYAGR